MLQKYDLKVRTFQIQNNIIDQKIVLFIIYIRCLNKNNKYRFCRKIFEKLQ